MNAVNSKKVKRGIKIVIIPSKANEINGTDKV
jgi:hypothetical protein